MENKSGVQRFTNTTTGTMKIKTEWIKNKEINNRILFQI